MVAKTFVFLECSTEGEVEVRLLLSILSLVISVATVWKGNKILWAINFHGFCEAGLSTKISFHEF